MSDNVLGRTERGFAVFGEFRSQWHGRMRINESSKAFQGPCAWVFCELAYSNTPKEDPPDIHLHFQDAVALRDALTRFIDAARAGECTEPASEGPQVAS